MSSYKFLGASVKSFNSSIGLGLGQQSQATIQVVIDPADGDALSIPPIYTPCYFNIGGLNFNGLLQKYEKVDGIDGRDAYTITLVDAREVLDCVQCILGSFNGFTSYIKNIFNIYGAIENTNGFGAAGVNEGGMPWVHIRKWLQQATNSPTYGIFGGPIHFKGYKYSLDLSEMPTMPLEYRIPAEIIGLTEMISQVCDDAGYDFFVDLQGFSIKIRTISRKNQAPLGVLQQVTEVGRGVDLVRSSYGVEGRNEVNSTLLIGGNVQNLYLTTDFDYFYGFDNNANPIVFSDFVPSGPIELITGDPNYELSFTELRCALASIDMWKLYISKKKPKLAKTLGLDAEKALAEFSRGIFKADIFLNNKPKDIFSNNIIHINTVYEFVRGYAENYYNRKYLVYIPGINISRDDETLAISSNYEIAEGGWLPEGSSPLGLSPANQNLFTLPDGRFKAFVRYQQAIANVDLNKIDLGNSAIENIDRTTIEIFQNITIENKLIRNGNKYGVIVTVDPVFSKIENLFNLSEALLEIFEEPSVEKMLKAAKNNQGGNLDIRVAPYAYDPKSFAIPIKINNSTYGPWYSQGADQGKVRVEKDESLVPWNYGSYEALNAVAQSRATESITNTQVVEVGTVEKAGIPQFSLGDILQFGGPPITNIDVSFSVQGLSTSYRFQTYTNRFGVLGRSTTERIKRVSLAQQQLRRNLKTLINDKVLQKQTSILGANRKKFLEDAEKAVKKDGSPHEVFIAKVDKYVDENDGYTKTRNSISSATIEEALVGVDDTQESFKTTVISGVNSVLSPYIISKNEEEIPSLDLTNQIGSGTIGGHLTPYGIPDSDKETFSEEQIAQYIDQGTSFNIRSTTQFRPKGIGLRQPMMMVGRGYDFHDKTPPIGSNLEEQNVGPLECYWNEQKKLWSTNNVLLGTIISGSGEDYTAKVDYDNGESVTLPVKPVGSGTLSYPSGNEVLLFSPLNSENWHFLSSANGSSITPTGVLHVYDSHCISYSSGGCIDDIKIRIRNYNLASGDYVGDAYCATAEDCNDYDDFCTDNRLGPECCEGANNPPIYPLQYRFDRITPNPHCPGSTDVTLTYGVILPMSCIQTNSCAWAYQDCAPFSSPFNYNVWRMSIECNIDLNGEIVDYDVVLMNCTRNDACPNTTQWVQYTGTITDVTQPFDLTYNAQLDCFGTSYTDPGRVGETITVEPV